MTLQLNLPEKNGFKPRIAVFGVGGAGGNAVNNMIEAELQGVSFVAANTDAQALEASKADLQIQLGGNLTSGLGAGASPEVGGAAAEESLEEILEHLQDSNMAFITAGMGGGTGTGAAPVIARAAREKGILTVGVVTKPFHFEGAHRMRIAEAGITELQSYVDTLIVIPNQNLFRIADEKTTFADAFTLADDVLHAGVRGVTDLIVMPGLINLDFADIKTVMSEMGKAMMGTGEAEGESRAINAAEAAISNPLLDNVTMKGAQGVLINITGGMDMTLYEVDEAANRIRDEVESEANIIFGSTFNPDLEGTLRVSVIATGINADGEIVKKNKLNRQDSILKPRQQVEKDAQERVAPATNGIKEYVSGMSFKHKSEPVVTPSVEKAVADHKNEYSDPSVTDGFVNAFFEKNVTATDQEGENGDADDAQDFQAQEPASADQEERSDKKRAIVANDTEETKRVKDPNVGLFGIIAGVRRARNREEVEDTVKVDPMISAGIAQQSSNRSASFLSENNEVGDTVEDVKDSDQLNYDAIGSSESLSNHNQVIAQASQDAAVAPVQSDVGVLEKDEDVARISEAASASDDKSGKNEIFEIPAFLRRKDDD